MTRGQTNHFDIRGLHALKRDVARAHLCTLGLSLNLSAASFIGGGDHKQISIYSLTQGDNRGVLKWNAQVWLHKLKALDGDLSSEEEEFRRNAAFEQFLRDLSDRYLTQRFKSVLWFFFSIFVILNNAMGSTLTKFHSPGMLDALNSKYNWHLAFLSN